MSINKTHTCQDAYDWREATAAISGMDLHELFYELVGDMSPSGRVTLPMDKLAELASGGYQDAQALLDGLAQLREVEYEDENGHVEVRRFFA
jgi:hypothetical protein